ncbi:hypothetical protein [Pseudophaeobacter sp. TrK17]|uniref:hypothetical protein n=1 Tax=Pseudophaeobacter sp. TrK17 TaxID=2815167 RepID=UPI0035D0C0B3
MLQLVFGNEGKDMKVISRRNLLAMLAITGVVGCAEGTTVVTGERRAAISAGEVQLFSAAPKTPYQTIALVNAKSGNGWTSQQSIDYAVDELKNQAAAVGANGVILGQPGSQLGGFVMSGSVAIPYDEQTVSGIAIYIQ